MQCKRMHGDRGRYLVNMGEKCNLMIPWTKVQKIFIAHMVQTTHKPLFYNWYQFHILAIHLACFGCVVINHQNGG